MVEPLPNMGATGEAGWVGNAAAGFRGGRTVRTED